MARVLQEEPRANLRVLGAHFETRIESLMSIFTSIFSHFESEICLHATTLRSWLEVMIFLSAAQSISLIV
jgi:hypothetical protein